MSPMGSNSFTLSDSCILRKRDTFSLPTKPLWAWEVGYTAFRVNTMCLAKRTSLSFFSIPASIRTLPVPILTHGYGYSVSTVRAALEVKQVFEQLAEAEKGGVTPEQKQKLEEQATEKVCPGCTTVLFCLLLCFGGGNDADPTTRFSPCRSAGF